MYENTAFAKLFARRSVICFFLIMLLFITCVLRVAVIANGNYAAVQTAQSSYRISVSKLRGTIYDCNMVPITNSSYHITAAVSPTPSGIVGISGSLSGSELESVLSSLKQNKPTVCTVKNKIVRDGITCTEVYEHTSPDMPAVHLMGYTDSSGHGVSGLEAAYDSLLYSEKTTDAVFTVDGRGNVLRGIKPYFDEDKSEIANGVVSTVDTDIQRIAENAAEKIESGAVVIAEAESGKIRALVSRPDFDATDIAASLNSDKSPLMNRALAAYSVGSVFKPCVAAAAAQAGKDGFTYTCTGSTHIIDRDFNCHKRSGHGFVDLRHALAFSCNTFFYNFAILTGADDVYRMASALNFGQSLKIADNVKTAKGNLTERRMLNNDASLANFSIGQGDILLTPVSMLTLYCAIASNGCYYVPSVVEKTVSDGESTNYDKGLPTRVMSEKTAAKLRDYLGAVITEGTGSAAAPKNCTAGGKTATAQTGRYDENRIEITNSWFCGFFPAEKPKYAVIVMSEGGTTTETASVFAEIADGVTGNN